MVEFIGVQEETRGKLNAVASGTLSNGDTVVVNSDGTVSAVAGATQVIGTPSVFKAAEANFIGAGYDPVNNKIVVAFADATDGNRCHAVVGSVSGSSISFGTSVRISQFGSLTGAPSVAFDSNAEKVLVAYFSSTDNDGAVAVGTISGTSISFGTPSDFDTNGGEEPAIAFDSTNNKIVVVYRDNGASNYGKARVGTVSGTSVSFGTEAVFFSGYAGWPSVTFDSSSGKVVIAYLNASSGSGVGAAVVGTVSGTSISFGTAANYITGGNGYYNRAVYDSNSNKVVIFFNDTLDGPNKGKAVVGTVSGTSISFGSVVTFASNASSVVQSATFDSNNNTVMCVYYDGGNSNYGTLAVGTVSGTSITFEAPVVFNAATTAYSAIVFDSGSNQNIIAYRDGGNSNYGEALIYAPPSTNITAENYIGISSSTVADT